MLGGDFNCTLNQQLDRNHNEPRPSSSNALKKIVDYYNFVDLWRDTFPGLRHIHSKFSRVKRMVLMESFRVNLTQNKVKVTLD